MSWVTKEISRWHEFGDHPSQIIPARIQVGKILSFVGGNVHEAERFIFQQIEADGTPSFDDYWLQVKRFFDELKVNEEIMGE